MQTTLTKNRNVTLLTIFALALTVKLFIFFFITDPVIFYKYPFFAERISKGIDIGERLLDLSPSYLYLHVLYYKIYGSRWEGLAILQILMGSLTCLFTYLIAEKIFNKMTGLIASVILILYGNLTMVELTLEPEALVLFINSLAVLVFIRAGNECISGGRPWEWFLAGALIGLSVITKPNALFILPGAVIWIWWRQSSRGKKAMATILLFMGMILLISPITLRNYLIFHDFVLVTADRGKVFFHGNGPGATGMERADLSHQGFIEEGQSEPDYAHALFRNAVRSISGLPLKPSECANFWFSRTLEHIRDHRSAAFFLEIKKLCFFLGDYEVHDIDSTYKNYVAIRQWPLIPFGIISALGLVGMGLSLIRFRKAFLLYWMVLSYLVSVMIFFSALRYSLPAAPFLSIFAACNLTHLLSLLREKKTKKLLVLLSITAILFAGTRLIFQREIKTFDQWQRATRIHYSLGGKILFKKGQYREAITEFEKSLALQPDFAPAYNHAGMSYAILGDYERAEKNFQKVITVAPGMDEGYLNLGLLYELKGDLRKAIFNLEKALSLNPENLKAKTHLKALNRRTPK